MARQYLLYSSRWDSWRARLVYRWKFAYFRPCPLSTYTRNEEGMHFTFGGFLCFHTLTFRTGGDVFLVDDHRRVLYCDATRGWLTTYHGCNHRRRRNSLKLNQGKAERHFLIFRQPPVSNLYSILLFIPTGLHWSVPNVCIAIDSHQTFVLGRRIGPPFWNYHQSNFDFEITPWALIEPDWTFNS